MAKRKSTEREEGRRIETLRVSVVRERSPLTYSLACPTDAAKVARELIGHDLDREVFGILVVDTYTNLFGTLNFRTEPDSLARPWQSRRLTS